MAKNNSGCLFSPITIFSDLLWVSRRTAHLRSFPRPPKLHTAQEAMEVVAEMTSEHGGQGAAFPYAQRALELDPQNIDANEFMGFFYSSSDRFSEALPYVELVAQSRPNSLYARVTRAQVWKGLGRLEDAVAEFQAALVLSPDSPGLWIMLGEALSALGRHAEAGDAYAQRLALGDGPSSVTGYTNAP